MSADSPLRRQLSLMVVTDPRATGGLIDAARKVLGAGAPAIQLRWKGATARQLFEAAEALKPVAADAGALFIVNDRLDVALAARADGVHLGDDDIPLEVARRIAPPPFVIGRSVDTVEEALAAARSGADYLGAGPVYGTTSKTDTGPVMGLDLLGKVCSSADVPVVGIGGIGIGGAAPVVEAGAAGAAVLGFIMFADDPAAATRALLSEVSTRGVR